MNNKYMLYNTVEKRQQIEPLLTTTQQTIPLISEKKQVVANVSSFLMGIKITATLEDKLVINGIDTLTAKIKPIQNTITKSIPQKFNIKLSYVASVDKKIIQKISEFYHKLAPIREINIPKVFFDASQENNLQKALHMSLSTQLPTSTEVPKTSENENTEIKVKSKTLVKESKAKKITGYATVFMLGTIAAALLTLASILIGIKILNP